MTTKDYYIETIIEAAKKDSKYTEILGADAVKLDTEDMRKLLQDLKVGMDAESLDDFERSINAFAGLYISETTPLIYSVRENKERFIRDILELGFDVNSVDSNGSSALIEASREGDLKMMEMLLDFGADINGENEYDVDFQLKTPIVAAAIDNQPSAEKIERQLKACKLLLDKGASAKQVDENGDTLLFWVVTKGNLDMAKLILKNVGKEEISVSNNQGKTALSRAMNLKYSDKKKKMTELLENELHKNEVPKSWVDETKKKNDNKPMTPWR